MRLEPIQSLSPVMVDRWTDVFVRNGSHLFQSPRYAQVVQAVRGDVYVAHDGDTFCAFHRRKDRMTALATDTPILVANPSPGRRWQQFLEALPTDIAGCYYFPQIGEGLATTASCAGAETWCRQPNSFINWTQGSDTLWGQVVSRGGSQARRRRAKAEQAGLTLYDVPAYQASDAVSVVESRSWKARLEQSMFHRDDQWSIYRMLLDEGLVRPAVLLDGDRPVAFRLDARTRTTVSCLKWSFDEDYKRLSPGFYLLTVGLCQSWSNTNVEWVDLYGSPDPLKELLYTHRVARHDVTWPPSASAKTLRQERLEHDERMRTTNVGQRGVRMVYEPERAL